MGEKRGHNGLGRFLARVLRHHPEAAGITLDENGWADVDALIFGVNAAGRTIDFEKLEYIVATDDKKRFSFNANKTKLRASQGHSINVDVQMKECAPPATLYHGTARKYLESIKQSGIVKKSRNYVHLSKDEATAVKVGSRHGEPVVLVIDCARMSSDGFKFFLSENGVWQTVYVPFEYVTEVIEN